MSVHRCIDLIHDALAKSHAISSDDRVFLEKIKERLNALADVNHYEALEFAKLNSLLDEIKGYKTQSKPLNVLLSELKEDLTKIVDKANKHTSDELSSEQSSQITQYYHRLIKSKYLHASINQSRLAALGNDGGACYGFTFSMADAALSPYKNREGKPIQFSREVYAYQKNQMERDKDQGKIKKTRLTRRIFCPSFKQQAEKLYDIASKNKGKDLSVKLFGKVGLHAVYLSTQEDGQIRYMDPNYGAFLFQTKEQFISAYMLLYMNQREQSDDKIVFNFFLVELLHEDPNLKKKESRTIAGKIRTLLTGAKYKDKSVALLSSVMSLAFGIGVGSAIGAIIGSVIPGFGTLIGACLGGSLGCFASIFHDMLTANARYGGLLGIVHYCEETLYNFKESMKAKLGLTRENEVAPDFLVLDLPIPESSAVLKGLGAKAQNVSSRSVQEAPSSYGSIHSKAPKGPTNSADEQAPSSDTGVVHPRLK